MAQEPVTTMGPKMSLMTAERIQLINWVCNATGKPRWLIRTLTDMQLHAMYSVSLILQHSLMAMRLARIQSRNDGVRL